jgi:hypothetical protein
MRLRNIALTLLAVLMLFMGASFAQQDYVAGAGQAPTDSTIMRTFTPTQLGVSALTLPASGTTVNTTTVNFVGVTMFSLYYTCTQSANLNVNYYAEDGTTLLRSDTLATGISTPAQYAIYNVYYGVKTQVNAGATAVQPFLSPVRAVSFSFTNAGATPGTCTARLVLQY